MSPADEERPAEVPAPPGKDDEEGGGPPRFVTSLAPVEQQVGVHVIRALQGPETVAVLTTVTMGRDGHQRIISVGLDGALLEQVRVLFDEASEERTERVPCVGFHCRLQDRDVESDPSG